jgi:acyl carrier protein
MTDPTNEARIRKILADTLDISQEDLLLDTELLTQGADSMHRLEICMAIEDEFDIDIPDEDFLPLGTLRHLVDYVAKATGGVA